MKIYSKYKPSGVDWLGEIPDNWNDYKIKFSTNVNKKTLNESTAQDFEFNYIDIESVNGSTIEKTQKLTFANAPSRARRLLQKGDVIVSTVRTYLKAIAQVPDIEGNIVASTGFAVFSPSKILFSDYLKYLAVNDYFIQSVVSRSKGANYPAIAPSELVTIKTPIPPINEQQQIVNFLDYKTGQCDRFIANRQKQIELLNEQKAAIINKSVTKGINTNAKMKPSGIEWIGDIPEHWKVSKVKFIANVKGRIGFRGYTITDLVDEGQGALTLGATHIDKNGEINLTKPVFISWDKYYESPEIMVEQGDILVVQRGSIGVVGIVNLDIGYATINPSLTILKKVNMNRYLLFLQLRSKIVKEHINVNFNETAVPMLSQNQILNFNILLLPTEEQQSIVDFITKETSKIETLISKYQKQIDLMQEYRTALISQAVTGKIDVRDWQPH
jgi:type I restriction enzyme S subunit